MSQQLQIGRLELSLKRLVKLETCWLSQIAKLGNTLARLFMAHDAMSFPYATKTVHAEEVLGLYSELMKSDPCHSIYYKDERSLVLLQQPGDAVEALLLLWKHHHVQYSWTHMSTSE